MSEITDTRVPDTDSLNEQLWKCIKRESTFTSDTIEGNKAFGVIEMLTR